jgi:hypothetical protein
MYDPEIDRVASWGLELSKCVFVISCLTFFAVFLVRQVCLFVSPLSLLPLLPYPLVSHLILNINLSKKAEELSRTVSVSPLYVSLT